MYEFYLGYTCAKHADHVINLNHPTKLVGLGCDFNRYIPKSLRTGGGDWPICPLSIVVASYHSSTKGNPFPAPFPIGSSHLWAWVIDVHAEGVLDPLPEVLDLNSCSAIQKGWGIKICLHAGLSPLPPSSSRGSNQGTALLRAIFPLASRGWGRGDPLRALEGDEGGGCGVP
jgi:hypothetical protein